MIGVAIALLICLFFGAVWAGSTVLVLRRVWKRRKNASRLAKLIASVIVASVLFGALGTLFGMVMAFSAVGGESVDPSQKARILAEGISEAMNCAALALAIWIPSVIVTFVITKRSKTDAQ